MCIAVGGMRLTSTKMILFNAAAGLVAVAVIVAVARPLVFSPTSPPCSERYLNGTSFALERGGIVLTAADLQSSVGGEDAGVLENVTVARVKEGPSPIALKVSIPKGSASPRGDTVPKGGMSFPWQPRSIQGKSAACLSYNVQLPADFDFHRGGRLPGIRGSDSASQDSFNARLVWRAGGEGGLTTRVTTAGDARLASLALEHFVLPRGRWFKVEQEIALNTPKKADGIARIWIDGKLVVDRADVIYRAAPTVSLSGATAEIFYGSEDGTGAAPKDTTAWLSPFELRWQ
jgi:hypothetical protein